MKITVSMATYNGRDYSKTIESIKNQTVKADVINIWNNEKLPNIHSQGKFFGIDKTDIHISIDDDIIYPKYHLESMINGLQKNRLVTLHGRILDGKTDSYYFGHKMFRFSKQEMYQGFIDTCGTGVSAYDVRGLDLSEFWHFIGKVRGRINDDIIIPLYFLKYHKIRPFHLQHKAYQYVTNKDGIFQQRRNNETHILPYMNEILKLKNDGIQ